MSEKILDFLTNLVKNLKENYLYKETLDEKGNTVFDVIFYGKELKEIYRFKEFDIEIPSDTVKIDNVHLGTIFQDEKEKNSCYIREIYLPINGKVYRGTPTCYHFYQFDKLFD